VVSTPRKLQYGNKFKNPNILKKKVLAWMCRRNVPATQWTSWRT
jgi:hypothetical protein